MDQPTIPIIDVSGLYTGDGLRAVAAAIGEACRTIGFFYVTGHGIADALIGDTFEAAKVLFALDIEAKEAVSLLRSRHNRGYVGMKAETLDPGKAPDLKEAFNIGLDLAEDDPEILAGVPFRGVNLWIGDPAFCTTTLAYFDAVWRLGRDLHRAVATDLGLPPDYFEDKLNRPLATLRLLHYPPMPAAVEQGQLGAGEHTDYGNITLLMTDAVGGLEVRDRTGRWMRAPVIENAFVCNIGDCLMRWTNDIYVSTPHRVVNPQGRERYSIAFFLDANPEAVVACLPTCTDQDNPPRYAPIRMADFLKSRLDPTYIPRDAIRP